MPDGRPYLVLEYVDGVAIDVYCDEKRLDINGRLRLFLCVAEAVQAAHSATGAAPGPEAGEHPGDGGRRTEALDNIVLGALEKQPQERYASVDQFSEDIRRYLEGRPVAARGEAALYVAAKFVRRNRVLVGGAALLFCTLAGGLVEVSLARRRAERRFNEVRQLAHSVMFDMRCDRPAAGVHAGAGAAGEGTRSAWSCMNCWRSTRHTETKSDRRTG